MKLSLTFLALAASVLASPAPQASTAASAGCKSDYSGQFQITVVKPLAKRDLSKRQSTCGQEGILTLTLAGGVLKDAKSRTGYIASNYQFQFDAPPQANALITSGFSLCSNSSAARGDTGPQFLTLSGTTTFYQCLSGSFYNLYNTNWAPQCSEVAIQIIPCPGSGSGPTSTAPAVSGTTLTVAPGTTPPPATVRPDGQPNASSAGGVYKPPVVTVISDGQPQAVSAIPVAQKSDGQPNMPTALVSQLADGQPQATGSAKPVSTTAAAAVVTQKPDGQPNAGNATVLATPTITPFKGAGAVQTAVAEFAALAAGVVAVAML